MIKQTWDDLGNVDRFIEDYGSVVRWVLDERDGRFMTFTGKKWEGHGADGTVKTMVYKMLYEHYQEEALLYEEGEDRTKFEKWAKSQRSASILNSTFRALQAHPALTVYPEVFDKDKVLLNFQNGTLVTTTMEWMPAHDLEDMQTRVLPGRYLPGAPCPNWTAFLESTLPDADTRHYLHKLVGYSLTGRSDEKILPWLYGPSNTGKSVIINALSRLFGGEYGITANDGALRPRNGGGPSNEIHSMMNKRFVSASETGQGQDLDEALIKRLTGGDNINSRKNYGFETNWKPECVIWVASNQYPRPKGDDDAIWERFRPILFETVFGPGNRDLRMSDKLEKELDGITTWAVEGLRLYLEEGLDELSLAIQFAMADFRRNSDDVARFIDEATDRGRLTVGPDAKATALDVHGLYASWAKESGTGVKSTRRFYDRLRTNGYDVKKSNGKMTIYGMDMVKTGFIGQPTWYGQ